MMMTFNTKDGRIIRARQRKLTGPLLVELLEVVNPEYEGPGFYTQVVKEIRIDPVEVGNLLAEKLGVELEASE